MKKDNSTTVKKAEQQRVLAIHDLSGHSHTSLMAIIPILNYYGIGVTALPTAILSSNTEQNGFQLVEMTSHLNGFLQQWKQLKLSFDAIYSGFLCSPEQVEIVLEAMQKFKKNKTLILVDPVMADDGKLYACFRKSIIASMKKLITHADIITPNLTEAAFLLGEKYQNQVPAWLAKQWCKRLSDLGPRQVIITNVPVFENPDRTSVICYDKDTDSFYRAFCNYLPVIYPGSGDIFACVLLALLLKGVELSRAINKTVCFVSRAMQLTMEQNSPAREGIRLEQALKLLPRVLKTLS
ncbi:MAG: pyridoxamine kinase [Candidatus Cloacimonadaceae bacterium]